MNKLIEKIISRFEQRLDFYEKRFAEMSGTDRDVEDWGSIKSYKDAIDIINEEAKAYNEEFNPTEDIIQYGVEGCMKEYYRRGLEDGKKANNEVKTNADYIRNMSDEELAEWLTKITDDAQLDSRTHCNYQWKDWLKAEREG